MPWLKPWFILALVLLTGCVRPARGTSDTDPRRVSVSFPSLNLADQEYVQSIEVEIRGGRVASINHLLHDWDMEMMWASSDVLNLKLQARHFSAGLTNLSVLDNFIMVESIGGESFTVTARLVTDSTEPTGRGEKRYAVSHAEFIFNPVADLRRNHETSP